MENGVKFMVTDTTVVVTRYRFLPSLIKIFIVLFIKGFRIFMRFFYLISRHHYFPKMHSNFFKVLPSDDNFYNPTLEWFKYTKEIWLRQHTVHNSPNDYVIQASTTGD